MHEHVWTAADYDTLRRLIAQSKLDVERMNAQARDVLLDLVDLYGGGPPALVAIEKVWTAVKKEVAP